MESMRGRWKAMLSRCEDPRNIGYHLYGGRGIRVCEHWHSFENFLADVGFPPTTSLTLDRIDNDGDYEPGNVRWATKREQRLNQRPRSWKNLAPCGSETAYCRHLRRGEKPCADCLAAHAARAKALNVRVSCVVCAIEIGVAYLPRHFRHFHPNRVAA
jgi:hypothetical protein